MKKNVEPKINPIEKVVCPECKGEGYLYNNQTGRPGYKCPVCNTNGYIHVLKHELLRNYDVYK